MAKVEWNYVSWKRIKLTQVVAFTGELDKAEECTCELCIMHVLLSSTPISPNTQSLGLRVALKCIQVEHRAGVHEASN